MSENDLQQIKFMVKQTLIEFFTQKYINMTDAAELTGKHPRTIRRWIDSGKLKTEDGKIPREEIVKYL